MTSGRWGTYAKSSDGVFVPKAEWAAQEIVFYIRGIRTRDASRAGFKDEWEVDVYAEDADETILTFSQGTGGRDDALRAAAADFANHVVTEIGPMLLRKVTTKTGNTFYALWDAALDAAAGSSTTQPEAPQAPAAPVPVSVPTPGEMP